MRILLIGSSVSPPSPPKHTAWPGFNGRASLGWFHRIHRPCADSEAVAAQSASLSHRERAGVRVPAPQVAEPILPERPHQSRAIKLTRRISARRSSRASRRTRRARSIVTYSNWITSPALS